MANCILIGNSGGGSSDVNIISQAEWDAMTFAEKQAAGMTIVGEDDGTSGKWFNYTNMGEEGVYLPYSEISNIITLANTENFDSTSLLWGLGSNPVTLQDYKTIDENTNSVLINVEATGNCGYVDLETIKRPVTIYAVMKISSAETSTYARHLSCMAVKSSNQGIIIYGKDTVKFSPWGTYQDTGISATDFYVVAFNYNGVNSFCSTNGKTYSCTPASFGRYLTIGRTTPDGGNTGTNEEPSDVYVKFIGVVDGAESSDVIDSNVKNLMSYYGITS